ncbi:MAG: hypothetical protein WDO74_08865 [Pseudomonadota bacterium]
MSTRFQRRPGARYGRAGVGGEERARGSEAGSPSAIYGFLAVPPSLPSSASPIWNFCIAPKAPTVDNVVSPACLDAASLVAVGEGSTVTAPTPSAACTLFGPNAAASGLRPRDPDVTGGYFQPLRVDLAGADPAFHLQRVLCAWLTHPQTSPANSVTHTSRTRIPIWHP